MSAMAMDVVREHKLGVRDMKDIWTRLDVDLATVARRLRQERINLVCIDFDHTLIGTHTEGQWGASPEALAAHVRGFFRGFVPAALDADIHVAIVTFTPQTGLVRNVLKAVFGEIVAARIPVRGADKAWAYRGDGVRSGKQGHMASAAEELMVVYGSRIERGTTLLIDDDILNVCCALEHGVRAILYKPDRPDDIASDLRLLFDYRK